MHVKDPVVHVRVGGLWKHEKIQQALVGLGSPAPVAAVAIPRSGSPDFPKGISKVLKRNQM